MKKVLFLSIYLFFVLVFAVFSQDARISNLIDLDISLKELSFIQPDELDSIIASDKYIIVDGSVSSITEIERSEDNLILDIHLINGEWIGLAEVKAFKCIVNISGKQWESRFPKRTPRELTEDLILLNNQILVIGKVSDYVMENSKLIAVIDAEYIRKIQ